MRVFSLVFVLPFVVCCQPQLSQKPRIAPQQTADIALVEELIRELETGQAPKRKETKKETYERRRKKSAIELAYFSERY